MKVREPAVAGSFYSGSPRRLREQIRECFLGHLGPGALPEITPEGEGRIIGLVSPHAGYMYSGPVATHGFYHLALDQIPKSIVLLGPNHTGLGTPVAMVAKGSWKTPLGIIDIDAELARKIGEESDVIEEDESAHIMEHSIEVQLPFLQFVYGTDFKFVPICMRHQSFKESFELGEALARVLAEKQAVIIATTDFTHYETQAQAEYKDKRALEAILGLDPGGLEDAVRKLRISMCGPGPVMAMLIAAKKLNAVEAKLLSYQTSGDITGDYEAVVGYASVKVSGSTRR
ncbi:MAG TPA: AmmeMemoRadiSam system protein B [Actinobacteria bacterium]|nr:AmmeMemoRadiSam system protein B [Actinomycetota bacterium]